MPAVVPEGVWPFLAFVAVFVGTGVVVAVRSVPKAYGLALVILTVFGLQVLGPRFAVEQALGFRPGTFLAGEAWWSPLTYAFVHADIGHIFGNLFILLTAGPALEERIGSRRFLTIYFLAAFAAAGSHLGLAFLDPRIVGMQSVAVGASGAIFGVLTAYAVRYPRARLPFLAFFIIYLPAFVVLLIYLGFNLAYIFAPGGSIAWWGHFAGFLVGLPFAYTMKEVGPHRETRAEDLPDVEALEVLATTPDLKEIHGRLRQFEKPEFAEDATWADAWLDRFFAKARCPECGDPLKRTRFRTECPRGDYVLDFSRARSRRRGRAGLTQRPR